MSEHLPGMDYLAELAAWNQRIDAWMGPGAQLVHVSSLSSDIRVYRQPHRVWKIRRLTPATVSGRPNSLEDEFLLLRWLAQHLQAPPAVPQAVAFRREAEWEALEMEPLDPPLTTDPVADPRPETIRGLGRLIRAVWRLNRAGISHGDLLRANAGADRSGRMTVVDFDQAAFGHWLRCVLRDFLGVPFLGRAAQFTVLDRAGELALFAPVVRRVEAARRRARARRAPGGGPYGLNRRAEGGTRDRLLPLAEAWQLAASSGANSPGAGIAYYSLDIDGVHFPGERPWLMRWDPISRGVDFRGKRVVELGCNLALLSIHALLSGAKSATGADVNPVVLAAAARTARAFGVEIATQAVDFDRDRDWEARLGAGDLVTALSLTYWLTDKDRLWRYLGRFPEVIFEGHEETAVTEARLRSLGFARIAQLGLSERRRAILHARR